MEPHFWAESSGPETDGLVSKGATSQGATRHGVWGCPQWGSWVRGQVRNCISMERPHDQHRGWVQHPGWASAQQGPSGRRQCRQTLDKSDLVVPTAQPSGLIQGQGRSSADWGEAPGKGVLRDSWAEHLKSDSQRCTHLFTAMVKTICRP